MATIQRPLKTYGTRKYVDEVAAAPGNYDPILANEVDGDLDTVYTAWNNELAQGILWQVSGATLTPTDATKRIVVPGPTTAETTDQAALVLGQRTIKGRVQALPGLDWLGLTANGRYTGSTWAQDDATKAGWQVAMTPVSDQFVVSRAAPGAQPTNLLLLDSAGALTTPANAGTGSVICGSGSTITRILCPGISSNYKFSGTWQRDDTSKPGHYLSFGTDGVVRLYYDSGAQTNPFYIDSINGNLAITGPVGQKASGTTWTNPSDRRMKDDIEDYTTGLDAILALRPRTFTWNGKGGSQAGLVNCSFIADEVLDVLPEMVGTTRAKLDADDTEDTDIQTLDTSNLILVVVNALKEIDARLRALEGR